MPRLQTMSHAALIVLAVIAAFTGLWAGADVFAPLVLALVMGVVLSPIAVWLERLGAAKTVGALAVLFLAVLLLAALLMYMGPVFTELFRQAPAIWRELRLSFVELQGVVRGITEATEEVARVMNQGEGSSEVAPEQSAPMITVTDAILAAPAFAAQLLIFVGTLFFFILSRGEIYAWMASLAGRYQALVADRLECADQLVSRYFLAIATINACFGALVATVLWVIGMPSPILWGVTAGLMNFILYLGPALVAVALLVGGIVVFDGFMVVAPAAVFVTLNMIEGQFVTPLFVGRHMSVNPLLVFLSLVFWLSIWGPIGGIIAIPVLIWGLALAGRLTAPEADTSDTATEPAQGTA